MLSLSSQYSKLAGLVVKFLPFDLLLYRIALSRSGYVILSDVVKETLSQLLDLRKKTSQGIDKDYNGCSPFTAQIEKRGCSQS